MKNVSLRQLFGLRLSALQIYSGVTRLVAHWLHEKHLLNRKVLRVKSAFSFLPRGFVSLIDYISPSAFDVIDWLSALNKSTKVSKELLFETSVKTLKMKIFPALPYGIAFDSEVLSVCGLPLKASMGQSILELYFLQLFFSNEVFLDLRKERFSADGEGLIVWKPNGLWYGFSKNFMSGIRGIYKGFYESNESELLQGLVKLGLHPPSMSVQTKAELRTLLESHFGAGRTGLMKFEITHFISSFDSLFVFLKKHKLRLSEDFLFLGIYILTLYLHLESLGESYDVASAFKKGSGGHL